MRDSAGAGDTTRIRLARLPETGRVGRLAHARGQPVDTLTQFGGAGYRCCIVPSACALDHEFEQGYGGAIRTTDSLDARPGLSPSPRSFDPCQRFRAYPEENPFRNFQESDEPRAALRNALKGKAKPSARCTVISGVAHP